MTVLMSISTSVPIVRSRADLRAIVAGWKAAGETVGVVPTMGALHAGHLSLVRAATAASDRVVVTLFVNPRQFNSAADLAAYPRTEEADARQLAPLMVDLLYVPDGAEMYPAGFATTISVAGVSEGLCGAHRPGHFDGVATVVTKLLLQTGADRAYFGEKDWQQLQVVRRLVADLDIACEIVPCPTVREADGLALSSRNLRLSARERAAAPALARALGAAARAIAGGEPAGAALAQARAAILAAGFREVEYLELRRDADLAPVEAADTPARILAAAWLGDVRLIDNLPVPARTRARRGKVSGSSALP